MLPAVVVCPAVRVLKVIPFEVGAPETRTVLVSALWVATRRMINKGAITLKQPTSGYVISNRIKQNTHLDLSQDRQEDIRRVVTGSVWADKKERGDGVESGGFDEHCYDGPVQRASSGRGAHGTSNVAAVGDEASGDHDGEDDVEADGDSEVGKTKVHGHSVPQIRARLRGKVESDDAHRFGGGRDLSAGYILSVEMYLQIEAK